MEELSHLLAAVVAQIDLLAFLCGLISKGCIFVDDNEMFLRWCRNI